MGVVMKFHTALSLLRYKYASNCNPSNVIILVILLHIKFYQNRPSL